jgi:cytochrome c oxidase subunit 2
MTFPFWPPSASAYAGEVDLLLLLLLVLVSLLSLPVFVVLFYFAIRYRRGGAPADRREPADRNVALEISWTVIPFVLTLVFFGWAAKLYFDFYHPPAGALEIDVVAEQWMWKFQHPGGQREINELHVPAGRPVKLTMISQDVIHSLFFPALRIKHDVLPGRYTQIWFNAEQPGAYHLLCAEFCGTSHSRMTGEIVVMDPAAYGRWLDLSPSDLSLAERGAQLYRSFGCSGCHEDSDVVRAPPLEGVFNSAVPLASGEVITADDSYLRDSILLPRKHVVAGYEPIMPSFQNRIPEDQLIQLIAYLKSLAIDEEEDRR